MPKEKVMSLSEAVNLIKDGDHIAFGGVLVQSKPMAFIWELLKPENRKKDLTISVLTANFGMDAILGLMNIKELNTIYAGLETAGFAEIEACDYSIGEGLTGLSSDAGRAFFICRRPSFKTENTRV